MDIIVNVSQGWYLISTVLIWAILRTAHNRLLICLLQPLLWEGSTSHPVLKRSTSDPAFPPTLQRGLCLMLILSRICIERGWTESSVEIWNKNLCLGSISGFWCSRGIMSWREQILLWIFCRQTKDFWWGQLTECEKATGHADNYGNNQLWCYMFNSQVDFFWILWRAHLHCWDRLTGKVIAGTKWIISDICRGY